MSPKQQLQEDLKVALKAGDENRKLTLRLLLAAIHNAEIDHHGPLDEDGELAVLRKQAKQRRDSIADFQRGGRADLVAQEQSELDIIVPYLPPGLDEAVIEAAARAKIAAVGAVGPADMGKVMAPLMKELGDQADGQVVSAIVRRLLAG